MTPSAVVDTDVMSYVLKGDSRARLRESLRNFVIHAYDPALCER